MAVAVDPTNPKILYAAAYGIDVFKSTDGGAHWRKTHLVQSTAYTRLAVDPRNPKTVFAATYAGLFVTRNGGASWAGANTGLADTYLFTVVIDPSRAGVVFVGAMGGVSRSADGGRTWRKVSAGISDKTVLALALHPASPGVLYAATWESGAYKSVNDGLSWVRKSSGLTENALRDIVLDPTRPVILYAATNSQGVFKSVNGGASWRPARTGLASWQPYRIAIDPLHPDTVYATFQSDGADRSIDGGAHWLPYDDGLPPECFVDDLAVDRNTGKLTAGIWEYGVFTRPAGASLWTDSNKGLTGNDVSALILRSDPSRLIAGIQSNGSAVFISTNDGRAWTASKSGINYRRVQSLAVDPENSDILYSGNSGSAYTSVDGGATWADSGNGLPVGSVSLFALLARRGGPGALIGGTYDGIWRSEGGTWKRAGLAGITILALVQDPASPSVIYAGTDGQGVFKSTNGGSSWKAAAKGLPAGFAVLALAVGGVYKSTDDGRTWARVGTGLAADTIVDALAYDAAKHLLYCGGSNGVYAVAFR